MPWYLVERTFAFENGLGLPEPQDSVQDYQRFVENNTRAEVVWLHSYITPDNKKSFCLYEAPTPEAVRLAASLNDLPVDRINEVRVDKPISFNYPTHFLGKGSFDG